MKTFNKKNDENETSLVRSGRVSEASLRCKAYGAIEELVAFLGLARNLVTKPNTSEIISPIQKELFIMGAELASMPDEGEKLKKHFRVITREDVNRQADLLFSLARYEESPNV
ncbi:ATP:cob(I)alamin adenosyltransferase [Chloroflexota bacterium]